MRSRRRNGGTMKNKSSSQYSNRNIILHFIDMLNTIKLFHWRTISYPTHKATDELYTQLNLSIDKFVEILLGRDGSRVDLSSEKSIPLHGYNSIEEFKRHIQLYKEYLQNMSDSTLRNDSDLINTRDEILGALNQFTYLLTFK